MQGEPTLKRRPIILNAVLLVLFFGVLTPQFAQDTFNPEKPDHERRSSMLGLIRTINTIEVSDFSQYGSFESWEALRDRHLRDLNEWLARFYSRQANVRFRRHTRNPAWVEPETQCEH